MNKWNKIGPVTDYNDGNKWIIHIEGRQVALFKYEDKFYALKNGCLHQGFPLADGNLKKYMVGSRAKTIILYMVELQRVHRRPSQNLYRPSQNLYR